MNSTNNTPIPITSEEIQEKLRTKLLTHTQIDSLEDFPMSSEFKNMDKAIEIFFDAVYKNEKIMCVCDSDCDGLGTYTLFWNFFKVFPYKNVEFKITNRKEGYGFLPKHVKEGVGLYITSDNGITSHEATQRAKEENARVIITDHHLPDEGKGLPDADAIIDPFIDGCPFPYKDISGTFVLWFFLKAIAEKVNLNIDMYNEFLPELAITTLSDVMPVDRHLNRFVVKDFLNKIKDNPSHREYINTFKSIVNEYPTAEDISFSLTPLINATQRMATAEHGALFLIQETPEDSLQWFNYLTELNNNRKKIQQELFEFIVKHYQKYIIDKPFIIIPGELRQEYKGVLGIIAQKLAEKYNKPAIVMNLNKETSMYGGSGRSVGDLNIYELVKIKAGKFTVSCGGHKQALGVNVHRDKFDDFYNTIMEATSLVDPDILNPKRETFGFITFNEISISLFKDLVEFEPFGKEFKRPNFITKARVKKARLIGKQKNHITLELVDTNNISSVRAMKFFDSILPEEGQMYNIEFTIGEDTYNKGKGDKVILKVLDMYLS